MSNETKPKITVGFDIGTTSVGWSVLDEARKILNYKNRLWYGVRLFDDASDERDGKSKNLSRREKRHLRRIIRRKNLRNIDFVRLLIKHKWFTKNDLDDKRIFSILELNKIPPLNLKVKGLSGEKLTRNEIIVCLYNYLQHRGFFYDINNDDNLNEIENNEKISLENDTQLKLKEKYPSQIQKEDMDINGYYIGSSRNELFSNKEWTKEIEFFLEKQNIDKLFIDDYLSLFHRIRDWSKGPGISTPISPFGLSKDELENGINLWDKTIGKCGIYPNEKRSFKKTGSAELFNLLNDLNNLRIFSNENWRMTRNDKRQLLSKFIYENKKPTLPLIVKTLKMSKNDLTGFRINFTNKKPVFEEIANIRSMYKLLKDNLPNPFVPWSQPAQLNIINDIVSAKSKEKKMDNLYNKLKEILPDISNDEILSDICKNITSSNNTHAFSLKALNEFIIDLYENENGQNQQNLRIRKESSVVTSDRKYLNPKLLSEEILSPTAKRSLWQAIKVLNKLIYFLSKEFEINMIAVEMTRDKNSAEEKKRIRQFQELNNRRNERIIDLIKNLSEDQRKKVAHKLWLAYSQDWKDLYDGKEIDRNDVIRNPQNWRIDHIIPYSISFMDNKNNKVLTKTETNKNKGNLTPYQWFKNTNSLDKYNKLKNELWIRLKENNDEDIGISTEKYKWLTFEKDPNDELLGFIGRNIADTSYTITTFFHILQKRFKNKCKVVALNGRVVDYCRKKLFKINKDRNFHIHHAIDATILAYITSEEKLTRALRWILTHSNELNHKYSEKFIDQKTGEIVFDIDKEHQNVHKIYPKDFFDNNPPTFSRMLYKKNNIQFFDETLYSAKMKDGKWHVIEKLDLLAANWKKELDPYLGKEGKCREKLWVYHKDKELYTKLSIIFTSNVDDKKNPFLEYIPNSQKIIKDKKTKINIKIGNRKNSLNLRFLKCWGKEIKENDIFKQKKLKLSTNKLPFFKSFKCFGAKYEIVNGVPNLLPINIKNSNILNSNLSKNIMIWRGTVLKEKECNQQLYYVVGIRTVTNDLEIKPISHILQRSKNAINIKHLYIKAKDIQSKYIYSNSVE